MFNKLSTMGFPNRDFEDIDGIIIIFFMFKFEVFKTIRIKRGKARRH